MATCEHCSADVSDGDRYCPSCQRDLGAPNCRECGSERERAALASRASESRRKADIRGCKKDCQCFESHVRTGSCVVVTLPPLVARNLCDNPHLLYSNYEKMVAGGQRRPAPADDDRRRAAVGGQLFGSYASNIRYGALSLTGEGVPTYGCVYWRLRQIAISDRVSFLEKNSYAFVEEHRGTFGNGIPAGHRAVWDNRHELAVAKLGDRLSPGQSLDDWQALLIESDGNDRAKDDFIEAHIFGGFDIQAVESMQLAKTKRLSRTQRLDAELALASFKELKSKAEDGA